MWQEQRAAPRNRAREGVCVLERPQGERGRSVEGRAVAERVKVMKSLGNHGRGSVLQSGQGAVPEGCESKKGAPGWLSQISI